MGQYHWPINLDKKEYIHPHKFGDGLKLMEFGVSGRGTMTGLAVLLAASNRGGARGGGDLHAWLGGPGYEGREAPIDPDRASVLLSEVVGRWAGDRIAIIGDYHEPDDIPGVELRDDFLDTLHETWEDISAIVIETMEMDYYIRSERHAQSAR